MPPVLPLILSCTACTESIITIILSKSSAPIILTSGFVYLIQHMRRLNLCQSSLSGPSTVVLRKDKVGSTSGLPRFKAEHPPVRHYGPLLPMVSIKGDILSTKSHLHPFGPQRKKYIYDIDEALDS